jgi:hypothetical protein
MLISWASAADPDRPGSFATARVRGGGGAPAERLIDASQAPRRRQRQQSPLRSNHLLE